MLLLGEDGLDFSSPESINTWSLLTVPQNELSPAKFSNFWFEFNVTFYILAVSQ